VSEVWIKYGAFFTTDLFLLHLISFSSSISSSFSPLMSDSVRPSSMQQQIHSQVGDKNSVAAPLSTNEESEFQTHSTSRSDIEASNRLKSDVTTVHPHRLPHKLQQQEQAEQQSQSDLTSTSQQGNEQLQHQQQQRDDVNWDAFLAPRRSQLSVRDATQFPKANASTFTPPVGKHLDDLGRLAAQKRGTAIRQGPGAHLQQYGGAHGANAQPMSHSNKPSMHTNK